MNPPKKALTILGALALFVNAHSAVPSYPVQNAADLQLALEKLNVLGSVLYIGTDNTWRWRKNTGEVEHQRLFLARREVTTEDRELNVLAAALQELEHAAQPPRVADVVGNVVAAGHRVWKLGYSGSSPTTTRASSRACTSRTRR